MNLIDMSLKQFRNFSSLDVSFHPRVNLICGDNGQGKTNLMEAIWLLTGAKSFRGAKEGDMLRFGQEMGSVKASFFSQGRDQEITLKLGQKRQNLLNGVTLKSAGELSQSFGAVAFSPEHLDIVKDGPEKRRRFLDTAIGQIKERYQTYLQQLSRILTQRNTLLRDASYQSSLLPLLDVYDEKLAEIGAVITVMRRSYTEKLKAEATGIYRELSGGKEVFSLSYLPSIGGDITQYDGAALKQAYREALFAARETDRLNRSTSVGPHRDDMEITLNNLPARSFGSQGQQRSCVLALKLAEGRILKEVLDDTPIMLLDDVLSELDQNRQRFILREIEEMQVFVTCCDRGAKNLFGEGGTYWMEDGMLTEEKGG